MALKGAAFWRFVQRICKLMSDRTMVDGQKNHNNIKASKKKKEFRQKIGVYENTELEGEAKLTLGGGAALCLHSYF